MLFPLEKLLEGREPPLCVTRDTSVSEALALMMKHDYSQLPIVDRLGHLVGIISEQTITRTYFHLGGGVALLDLTVDHCQTRAVTLPAESDLFDALDRLKDVYAIVVTKNQQPVGILTDYDTTYFFRDLAGGLIFVEDIEVTLRQHIEATFPDEAAMLAALMSAFGPDRRDGSKPAREFEQLNFGETIRLVTDDRNWPKFKGIFEPKDLFIRLMDQVRMIRNQLAHFRGRPDFVQYDVLQRAIDWLGTRPGPPAPPMVEVRSSDAALLTEQAATSKAGKYELLHQWLMDQREHRNDVRVTFQNIETLISESLPPSARTHRAWWANDTSHSHALAWLQAGWRVDDVDLAAGEVTFRQTNTAHMQLFFSDLLQRLRAARPGLTRAEKASPQNWKSIGAGRSGFSFSWVWSYDTLRVELYIDTEDYAKNKAAFDALHAQQQAIEQVIGSPLEWHRIDDRRASRVCLERPARLTAPTDELESIKSWALETMLKFVDAFQPRIRSL